MVNTACAIANVRLQVYVVEKGNVLEDELAIHAGGKVIVCRKIHVKVSFHRNVRPSAAMVEVVMKMMIALVANVV